MHCTCQGKGDAILFIHGLPTNRKLWDGVIQHLSPHHRCFAIDLPGMGETPFVPYGADFLECIANRIESLRIQHAVRKWHIVGHDAGSAIAVQYASRYADRVACLALMSPAIFPELKPYFLLSPLRRPLLGEALAPLVNFVFWKIAMRRAIAGKSNSDLLRAFYRPFAGMAGGWRLMRLIRWGKPEDVLGATAATLPKLRMPTLIFHGQRDVLPASFADRAASLIPNSSVVTLDSGHFIPLDRPLEVAARLRRFFKENCATMAPPLPLRKIRMQVARPNGAVARSLGLKENRPVAAIA